MLENLENIVIYAADWREITDHESSGRIACWSIKNQMERERAAIEKHRRPKPLRRRRSRSPRPVQLCLPFPEFRKAAA